MDWVLGALILMLMIETLFGILVVLSLAMRVLTRLRSGMRSGIGY